MSGPSSDSTYDTILNDLAAGYFLAPVVLEEGALFA